MNVHDRDIAVPKVTTGPIAGSRKIYATPEAAPTCAFRCARSC